MLADPKNFTKEELGELFCMELEGLTLASFFQAKEKCTTLKCVKYNVRKSQVTTKPKKKSEIKVYDVLTYLIV